jgi:hypothetical protein
MFINPKMKSDLKKIKELEDKYGLVLFRMALTHLFDVGVRHIEDKNAVEKSINAIMEQSENKDGGVPIMTPKFQCDILRCASALAEFTIWTLFAYIKKHVVVK